MQIHEETIFQKWRSNNTGGGVSDQALLRKRENTLSVQTKCMENQYKNKAFFSCELYVTEGDSFCIDR